MSLYRYKALNARGDMLDGRIEAAGDADAALKLQEQGYLPVEIRPATQVGDGWSWRAKFRHKPLAGARLPQFTQQLATLLESGQPLDRALSILHVLPEDAPDKAVIAEIREAVRGGIPLSVALDRREDVFPRLYVNLVRAGEAGGNLQGALRRLADYLERSRALRGRVVNALVYPVILLVVVGLSLLFLLGYVVPQFSQMYESLDVALPWFTRAVLAVGHFVGNWWFVLVAVPMLALWWLERKRRNPEFRLRFDAWLLRRRWAGLLVARLETARMARTLGTLLENGVPLLTALGISRNVLGNLALASDVDGAVEDVKNGHGLATSLGKGGRFPSLALQMIQVGEESGALNAMLLKTADTFEQETAYALDRMLAALVPAITLVLAALVGMVIIAVLVPLYDLTGAIG